MMRLSRILPTVVFFWSATSYAYKFSIDSELLGGKSEISSIEVHGFISQGYILSDNNNFLNQSEGGDFEYSEAGVNLKKLVTDKFSLGVQLVSLNLGSQTDSEARFDWYHLDYRWENWLGLRVGKVKIPYGLYNEIQDFDAARTPVLLPQSNYPFSNRTFLLAQNGVDLYGFVDLGRGGALDYRLYGGTIDYDPPSSTDRSVEISKLRFEQLFGGRLIWETPVDGLRTGLSAQRLKLQANINIEDDVLSAEIPALLWMASVEYVYKDLQLATEYSRWEVAIRSSDESILPEAFAISERYYLMMDYGISDQFRPGFYYSKYFPDVKNREGQANTMDDIAVYLRYDITPHWIVKIEDHFMFGTAGLDPGMNNGVSGENLSKSWNLFLLKTTGYF